MGVVDVWVVLVEVWSVGCSITTSANQARGESVVVWAPVITEMVEGETVVVVYDVVVVTADIDDV